MNNKRKIKTGILVLGIILAFLSIIDYDLLDVQVNKQSNESNLNLISDGLHSSNGYITIYTDQNYAGTSQLLTLGMYDTGDLTIGNNDLSSLQVPEGFIVTLYDGSGFSGNTMIVTSDTPNVGTFNDKTSSIMVALTISPIIYTGFNYGGISQILTVGMYDIGDLTIGNDVLSSVQVPEGFIVTLFEGSGFSGNTLIVTSDLPIPVGISNDAVSSIIVEYPTSPVIFESSNYSGVYQILTIGMYDTGDLMIGNDVLSSLWVPEGYVVTLYAGSGFSGNTLSVTTDSLNVGTFNDNTSSIMVEFNKSIDVDILYQSFTEMKFTINFTVLGGNDQVIFNPWIQIWWDGINVSTDIIDLGGGLFSLNLAPITVAPGEDPILLNMTISAEGYQDKHFETYLAVDPETLDKGDGESVEEIPLTIIIIAVTSITGGIGVIGITIYLLRKRK